MKSCSAVLNTFIKISFTGDGQSVGCSDSALLSAETSWSGTSPRSDWWLTWGFTSLIPHVSQSVRHHFLRLLCPWTQAAIGRKHGRTDVCVKHESVSRTKMNVDVIHPNTNINADAAIEVRNESKGCHFCFWNIYSVSGGLLQSLPQFLSRKQSKSI